MTLEDAARMWLRENQLPPLRCIHCGVDQPTTTVAYAPLAWFPVCRSNPAPGGSHVYEITIGEDKEPERLAAFARYIIEHIKKGDRLYADLEF